MILNSNESKKTSQRLKSLIPGVTWSFKMCEQISSLYNVKHQYILRTGINNPLFIDIDGGFFVSHSIRVIDTSCLHGTVEVDISGTVLSIRFMPKLSFLGCTAFVIQLEEKESKENLYIIVHIQILFIPAVLREGFELNLANLFPFEKELKKNNKTFLLPDPNIRTRLPTRGSLLQQSFKTCAVIGNSGNLRNKSFGSFIDSHEAVFRTNAPPLLEYVTDVGKKTSIMFSNKMISRSCWIWTKGSRDGKAFGDMELKIYTSARNKTEHRRIDTCAKLHPNIDYFIQSSYWYVLSWLTVGKYSALNDFYPTTGLFTLLSALPICDKISLFGYSNGNATSDYHYYVDKNKVVKPWSKHDFSAEKEFIQDLCVRNTDVLKEIWPLAMYKDLNSIPDDFLRIFS